MRKRILLLFLTVSAVSCNQRQNKAPAGIFAPKVTEAKGYSVPKDSISEPVTVPAGIPKTVKAGNPIINLTNLNVHIAGQPEITVVGLPKINTPGTDTFLLPKTIITKGIIKRAGIPEVLIAKDAAAKDINPANFSFYKTPQGLKQNTVRCMLQDKTGNLWLGTNGGGVCRYDGKSFTNFTEKEGLSNNSIYSILEDKTGNLWFATYGGVCCYDGKSFTNYTEKEGLINNHVYCIVEDKIGNLWFGTNGGGVCRYDGNRVEAIERGEKTPPGAQQDLKKINGKLIKSFTNYTEKEGLSNNNVLSILEDKSGTLWLGSDGGGLCRYDGKSFTNYTEKEGLSNNNVLSILEDKSGNLWFGTAGGGVCRYDGKSFTIFTEKEGLSSNVVLSILEDKIGNLWFGTYGGGVCRYDGKSFTNYTEKEGLISSYIYIILEDKTGNLWFGGNGGVCRYDGNRVEAIERGEKIPPGAQQDLKKINGKFVKSFTNYTKKEGLSDPDIYSIIEDKIGNLWFGTGSGGVCRYDGNRVEAIERGEKTPPGAQQDLKKINGKLIKSFTNYTEKAGLSNNCVWSILEDKSGNLWFSTGGGGVFRYDGNRVEAIERGEKTPTGAQQDLKKINGKLVKSFTNFTEKEGLNNNSVLNMMQDVDGNIWFGTRNGLSKVTAKNLANFGLTSALSKKGEGEIGFNPIKEAFFYNYGYNDGFLGINSRRNSVLQDSKGRIWWGTNILTCFDPKGSITDTTAPIVNLTSVKLFGEEIAWANLNAVYTDSTGKEIIRGTTNDTLLSNGILLKDIQFDGLTKWYNLPVHLSLPYNNNNITFNFIGVHMQSRNYVKYQYKLEDIDPDWSSITDRTEAPYGNLPSGDYIFKIKAMNQSGVWSESFEYKFVVRPPWWRTWWFRTLVGLLTIGSIFYFIKSREKKLVAEKEKLEKTVDERTAEVIAQKHIVEEKHKEITDSINYAERIQRALLASKKMLDENLSNYFILFKPKDVVSGDFYWAAKLSNKQFVLVTADSTGHGVPGAIMSIVNIASLKAASLQGITSPDLLLNETRRLVIENLKNDGSAEGGKDGMDGSL
ncbi:MAG: triple tyrosine motif-containing protein, partial [Bacteroidetes bacterium]|nr:triple tyrosine motif-containing protein [Bacteroidota bacterium]